MRDERLIYFNPHDPSRREFVEAVETEGQQYDFEMAASVEKPIDLDKPMNGTPTMMVVEGEGIDSVSRYAVQKVKKRFPDVYVVAIRDSGHANWANATLKRGEVNIMEELAKIEH